MRLAGGMTMGIAVWLGLQVAAQTAVPANPPEAELLFRVYEACKVCAQQTGSFPRDFRDVSGYLSETLRGRVPAGIQFENPESSKNRLLRKSPIGERTPCLRLKLDKNQWLNVSNSGAIFESGLYWESEFVDLLPRPYANPKLLELDTRSMPERAATRSAECNSNQVNLAPYCNAIPTNSWFNGPDPDDPLNAQVQDSIDGFPIWARSGLQEHHGLKFDVRAALQIEGQLSQENLGPRWIHSYPNAIKGIPIRANARRIHLLAGTIGIAETNAVVGIVQLNFGVGDSVDLPLRYGEHLSDAKDDSFRSERLFPVGSLSAEKLGPDEVRYSLHYLQLESPRPGETIVSFNFISGMKSSHPYILAMTLEP
jgi:hypothetical protein